VSATAPGAAVAATKPGVVPPAAHQARATAQAKPAHAKPQAVAQARPMRAKPQTLVTSAVAPARQYAGSADRGTPMPQAGFLGFGGTAQP
jgi:hypothetical protein